MALNIDGTTGISGVDGSASAPALQGTDSNTGINFGTDTVNINTGGVTRTTVASDGVLTNQKSGIFGNTSDSFTALNITSSTSGISELRFADTTANAGFVKYEHSGNNLIIATDTAERFRIKDTSFRSVGQAGDFTAKGISLEESSVGGRLYIGRTNDDTVAEFHRSNTRVGTISVNSSNTSYNTSSDYRLKENVVAISDGITRLKTLKPSRFNFKIDTDTTVDGFLAHEVSSIVPEAITGTKDEVDSDNNPVYQGIDQSKLVPLLTAALQEAIAKIEVLETKVAALEAA